MISDAALDHLKSKMDGFTDLSTFAIWWQNGQHPGIGYHCKTDKRVQDYKEQTKVRLGA